MGSDLGTDGHTGWQWGSALGRDELGKGGVNCLTLCQQVLAKSIFYGEMEQGDSCGPEVCGDLY